MKSVIITDKKGHRLIHIKQYNGYVLIIREKTLQDSTIIKVRQDDNSWTVMDKE